MITTFDIKGFKSVRQMHLDCRRINLFIGEPNTGKSNILEALGFLSFCAHGGNLRDYVRFEQPQNLFYDELVEAGGWKLQVGGQQNLEISGEYENGRFLFRQNLNQEVVLELDALGDFAAGRQVRELAFIKHYRFKRLERGESRELGALLPPNGVNIVSVVYASRQLKQMVADYFSPFGLQLLIKPRELKFEVQKQLDGVAVAVPFLLASDTLQRMVFYTVAIESNSEATLVFEEPEAHAFPYFTKYLGERIALDDRKNQYFISTHNPYLLSAVVEKAPAGEVAVFATYYRNYETKVKLLTEEELNRLFEADPFLGIEDIVEDIQ